MRDFVQSLESRQLLSAVAAHVVGSTLKITGTPHNDSIVVSLKGHTLTVNANKIARTFPAKGIKLIDLRGGGGHDKLQVTAPIAYKLNGGKTHAPVVASLIPVQTTSTMIPPLPSSGSSGTLCIAGSSTTESIGTLTGGAVTNVGGSGGAGTTNPVFTGVITGTGLGGSATCYVSATATLTIARACTGWHLVLATISAGQIPQINFSGDQTAWNQSALDLTLSPSAPISPGTYPLISFADAAYLPGNVARTTFSSASLPEQYTYNLALNAASRTLDLVIADKPMDAGANNPIVFNRNLAFNETVVLDGQANMGTGQLVINSGSAGFTNGILLVGVTGGATIGEADLLAGGGVWIRSSSSPNPIGATVGTLIRLGTNINLDPQLMPDTPQTIRIGLPAIFGAPSPTSLTALYLKPTMTVEFMTLPSPNRVPMLTLNGGESIYVDHPLGFTITLVSTANITPGAYPLVHFADGAYMPEDISGMQFKSDTLPAQYTYTLALNAANRTIDLVIADAPAAST